MNIKNLNVAELLKLRTDVDNALRGHRVHLESQLASLSNGSRRRGRPPGKKTGSVPGKAGSLAGKKVAPKYRSLEDKSLVWSGRGGRAKWLTAEMKASKKPIEAFLIK